MAIPNTNLSVTHLAEEYTSAGIGVRARARCVAPDNFTLFNTTYDYFNQMAVPNSPVWTGSQSEDWVAVILDSTIVVPNANFPDLEGAQHIKPGMTVDDRDPIFGGKKVVHVQGGFAQTSSLWVQIVILKPALDYQQSQAALNLNRTGNYWMNFWSGSLGSYTRGVVNPGSPYAESTLSGVGAENAGLVDDLPSNSFARTTPSTHSSNPGSISMGLFRGVTSEYTASYTMPSVNGFVENVFGALPTSAVQTKLSTVYKAFTVPDTSGVNYEVAMGEYSFAVGGRWRSYTDGSYYGGGTDYWYSYFQNAGWAIYDVTDGGFVLHASSGNNSHTTTGDGTMAKKLTGPATTVAVQAGKTYRVYYRMSYWQTAGMGDPENDMLFIAQDTSYSITRSSDGAVVLTGSGTKPTITVKAVAKEKWKDQSSAYFVPNPRGTYDTTQKGS